MKYLCILEDCSYTAKLDISIEDFDFICPVCGNLVIILEDEIPLTRDINNDQSK